MHRTSRTRLSIAPLALALTLVGCTATEGAKDVSEQRTVDWEVTTIQEFAGDLAAELVDAPKLSYAGGAGKVDDLRFATFVAELSNESGVHVATEELHDALCAALSQSGKFRFVSFTDEDVRLPKPTNSEGALNDDFASVLHSELGAELTIVGGFRRIVGRERSYARSHSAFSLAIYRIGEDEPLWSRAIELRWSAYPDLFRR